MIKKEKILVFLGSFKPYDDAISNVVYPFLEELKKNYEIDIYTRSPKGELPLFETMEAYHIYRDRLNTNSLLCKFKYRLSTIRNVNLDITEHKHFIFKKILVHFLNIIPDSLFYSFIHFEKKPCINLFSEMVKNKHYTLILTISSPIQSQIEALKIAKTGYFKTKNVKWIAYFVDPFATYIRNIQNKEFKNYLKFETEVYQYADAIFVSPEMYEDNKKYPMYKYLNKTFPIQFASMKKIKNYPVPPFMNPKEYNIVYTGSLFDHTVRKPDYFFMLASKLPKNIQIFIACNLINPTVEKLKEKYLDNHSNIHWLGNTPIDICFSMMHNCDVVINLGNEAANQTPSKVFDYIGMHKPIISFYTIDNDTSKKYLEQYPNKLLIKNQEKIKNEDIDLLEHFIFKSKNETINHELIDYSFAEYRADNLAKIFAQQVAKIKEM